MARPWIARRLVMRCIWTLFLAELKHGDGIWDGTASAATGPFSSFPPIQESHGWKLLRGLRESAGETSGEG